jgi:osmotically-inducible protein OsmY
MIAVAGTPADRLLANKISTNLADTNRFNLKRLAVDVQRGEVTIRGCVGSFYERQIAIQTCRLVPGIDRLIDALDVADAA